MDFVDWCGRVLAAMAQVKNESPQARSMGMSGLQVCAALFGEDAVFGETGRGFHGSPRHVAVMNALVDLDHAGIISKRNQQWWQLGQIGEAAVADRVALWSALADIELTPERQALLEIVNRLSPRETDE